MPSNGTPPTIEQLREQRQLLEVQNEQYRLKIENGKLKGQQRLLESVEGLADYWDFGGSDLWYTLRNAQGQTGGAPPSVPSDRRHGADWPFWRTVIELAALRQRSRVIGRTNPYAIALVSNMTNYLIGTGCKYQGKPKDGFMDDEEVQSAADQMNEFLDRWCKRNRWNGTTDPFDSLVIADSRERESVRRVVIDGECLHRLYYVDDGWSDVRWVEPEQLDNKPGKTEHDGWFCGILHQMKPYEDVERRLKYYLRWMDTTTVPKADQDDWTGEEVDADEIVHIMAAGTPATISRGTPMFTFGIGDAFERALKLEKNSSIGASIRAATAELWKHTFATAAQITDFAAALAPIRRTPLGRNTVEQIGDIPAGTVRRVPDGQEPLNRETDQTASYLEGVQADLRAGSSAFSAPEYWTGATDNGNYSNLETASAPTVKMGETLQEHMKAGFMAVVWRAVRHAVNKGLLPKTCLTACDIQCEGPKVLHRDSLQKAQEDQIKVQLGTKDRKTCCMEDGLDWDQVEASNAEYTDTHGPDLGQLQMPPDEKPVMPAGVGGGHG